MSCKFITSSQVAMPSVIQITSEIPFTSAKDPALQPITQARIRDKHEGSLLQVSPYTDPAHLLDLNKVDKPQQLLAKALRLMEPTTRHAGDFATTRYAEAFNWDEVVQSLRQHIVNDHGFHWQRQDFYVVVFRSRLPLTTDRHELGRLDKRSHDEATKSGGLLKYWFGEPDANGRNLATCAYPQAKK